MSVPREGRLIALSDRVLKAALDRPRLSAWVAGKMATEKLVRRELLKAPALLGGEGRPLLRHCVVTRESGSLAGWRTVSWLMAVDERRWFERMTINFVPTRQGASLVERAGLEWWM